MGDVLTEDQKCHISEIFRLYEENLNRQYEATIKPEIELLARYKEGLAKAYHEVAGQRNTLIGCMHEILNKQDELIGLCNQLGDMAFRIEKFFLSDTQPSKKSEYIDKIDREIPIGHLFTGWDNPISNGIEKRIIHALIAEGITNLYMLQGKNVMDLARTPNLGAKSCATVIFLAEKMNIKIPFNNYGFPIIRRQLMKLRGEKNE